VTDELYRKIAGCEGELLVMVAGITRPNNHKQSVKLMCWPFAGRLSLVVSYIVACSLIFT
jgi:hypothetical protein